MPKLGINIAIISISVLLFLLFTTVTVLGSNCFSPSPSIEAGRGAYDEIIPEELEEGEYEDLEELLESLDGRWEGTAEVLVCLGTEEEPIEEVEQYLVSSKVSMRRSGDFAIKSTLNSREKRKKFHETIRLHLSKRQLATEGNRSVSDLELISASNSELIYLRKVNRQGSFGNARKVEERVTAIQKSDDESFVVEQQVYLQGVLKSISIWNLEKN